MEESINQLPSIKSPFLSLWQCCGSGYVSGSGLDPDSMGSLDPHPVPDSQSLSGSKENKKQLKNFIFWSAGCSLLRAEGFSRSLVVLYGGLGISKLQFRSCIFFPIAGHQNSGPVSEFIWNAGSGFGFNESGSTTLLRISKRLGPD
jgi:hypothetical protein